MRICFSAKTSSSPSEPARPQPAKKRCISAIILGTSAAAAISLQECIESMAFPASTVRIPSSAAVIGPIVLPQPRSERTTKRWVGTSASAAQRSKRSYSMARRIRRMSSW